MEWVCEQHQKGKYLYTNACCSQVIGLQRASSSSSSVEQESSPTVLSSACQAHTAAVPKTMYN